MPGPYKLTVPDGANGFTYNGDNYSGGGQLTTNNPCEAIAFYNAFKGTNPDRGRSNGTPRFWQTVERECSAQPPAAPANPAPVAPTESNPGAGGDNAGQQGAPSSPPNGNLNGGDTPGEGGAGDGGNTAPTEEDTRPPEGEEHPDAGGEHPLEQTDAGDPVDLFSGSFYLAETDLVIPNSVVSMEFTRFYRSGAPSFGPFGWNWDHNWNLFLRELKTGDIAVWQTLSERIFKFDGVNYGAPRSVFEKLEKLAAPNLVFEITREGGTVLHFEQPAGWTDAERIPVVWIKDRHGNQLRFTYGAEDKLTEVRDDDDRYFHFAYDACGLLVAVKDHTGRKFTYAHDEQTMQLTVVTSPATSDFPGGIARIYSYEDPWAPPRLRHNIVRVEDHEGNVYLENAYEQDPASFSFARITEQLYGGYLWQFRYRELQYVQADPLFINIPSVQVEVMTPDLGLETYTFNYRGDLLDRRYRLNKDKSFRIVAWVYEFDEAGNQSKITRPDGSEEINVYDFSNADARMRGKLLQKEITAASGFPAPSRIIWRGKYENRYQLLTEEKNESGSTTRYRYDFDVTPAAATNSGKLVEIIQPTATLPDGSIQSAKTVFEYNGKGQLSAAVLPDGTRNEFEYGVAGHAKSRLVKQRFDTATLGIETSIEYDGYGFEKARKDGNGNTTIQVFNALGLAEKTILPAVNGITAEYGLHYNSDKKLIASKKPTGSFKEPGFTESFILDEFDVDVLGFTTRSYVSSNTSEARRLKFKNDYRGVPLEVINPDGSRMKKVVDERGLIVAEEVTGLDGKKIISKKVFDRTGKVIQETNPFGLVTRYEYDGFSRLSKITTAEGTVIRKKWKENDLLESEEVTGDDGTGTIRQLAFKSYLHDDKNRVVKETVKTFGENPAQYTQVSTIFYHDELDRIVKTVNPLGGENIKEYDGLGRVIMERDAMGNDDHFVYDGCGNLVRLESRHKEPDGGMSLIVKEYRYDERNRRVEMRQAGGGTVVSEYDNRNLLVKQTDPLGIVKESFYNSFNNKIREVHDSGGLNIVHEWAFDNMSRLKTYKDPTGEVSNYQYDSLGRNVTTQLANGFSSTKTYNDKNQIVKEELGSGVQFEYTYDNANRLVKLKNTVNPAPVLKVEDHEFVFDGLGRLVSGTVAGNAVRRKYDSQGRLISENCLGDPITCHYDDAAGVVEKTWPDGRKERLTHNLDGVLSKIEEITNGTLGSGISGIAIFKTSGPNALGEAGFAGGTVVENRYDDRKRLTEVVMTSGAGMAEHIKYRYNDRGMMQVEGILGQNEKISYYEYDGRLRVVQAKEGISVAIPDAMQQNEHDAAINAVRAAGGGAAAEEKFQYNPADARIKYEASGNPDKNYTLFPGHKIKSDGTHTYDYTSDGSIRSDGLLTYDTDSLGRIVRVKSGTTILTEISYDALGRPSAIKEVGRPDRSFNYLGAFAEQENENGVAARQITLHPITGKPIAYHCAGATYYTLFDSRFNLIGLADTGGNLLETYRYTCFGYPQIFDNTGNAIPGSAFNVEPIFGGQCYKSSSGLYLSKRRAMNPVDGVFLSPDPKGYVDSPSLYSYCAQDPVNNIDPNGEVIPFIVAAFVIGGALAGAGYSAYDAYHHPNKYEGWQGSLRVLGNVFGGAAIGGLSIVAAEAVLGLGGAGIFAAGTEAVSLTATQTFVLYGTSSAVSGTILRGGFNSMFPEYIDPVTARSITTDFALGGSFGVVFKGLGALANRTISEAAPAVTPTPRSVGNWWRFWTDAGGSAPTTGSLGPYPGKLGAMLDKIGIRQGYGSNIINNDIGGSWFARTDTAVHEGFHAFVARYFPTFRDLSRTDRLGAIARYPEEVVAYALGHGGAGRIHGIPLAPIEAFGSLSGYSSGQQLAAKLFWGTVWALGLGGLGISVANAEENHPNGSMQSK